MTEYNDSWRAAFYALPIVELVTWMEVCPEKQLRGRIKDFGPPPSTALFLEAPQACTEQEEQRLSRR